MLSESSIVLPGRQLWKPASTAKDSRTEIGDQKGDLADGTNGFVFIENGFSIQVIAELARYPTKMIRGLPFSLVSDF